MLLADLLGELGVPGRRAAARQPRRAATARPRLPRGAAGVPARPRGRALRATCRSGSTSTRCAPSTADDEGTPGGDGERADDRRPPRGRGRRALRRGARAARRRRGRLRGRPDPGARPRLLHAHDLRVRLRPPRRAVGGRRRRPLRRPGRAARRAADAGGRLGGRDRADPAGAGRGRTRPAGRDVFVAVADDEPAQRAIGAGGGAAPRRRLGRDRPRRAQPQGPAQAGRPDRRPPRR